MSTQLFLEDRPEIQKTIKSWLDDVSVDVETVSDIRINPIECHSRDGFIRASHNFGGFDLDFLSYLHALQDSSSHFDSEISEIEDDATRAAQDAVLNRFPSELEGWSRDGISYPALVAAGLQIVADRFEEEEREAMDVLVACGVRVMYEGETNGEHTLMVYVSAAVGGDYGPFCKGSKDLLSKEIQFSSPKELESKLADLTKTVTDFF